MSRDIARRATGRDMPRVNGYFTTSVQISLTRGAFPQPRPCAYFDAVIRACTGFMLCYFFECGVPMYGNSFRMSVWGLRPVGGH
jgi:hypothetical protein